MMQTAYALLALVLVWSSITRLRKTDMRTWAPVRWAFAVLGGASGWALLSVLTHDYRPDVVDLLMMAAITGVQLVSAKLWQHGVPTVYDTDHSRLDEAETSP